MYIGKTPIVGNFQKCDAISVVNGQAAYTLQVSSTNVVPESANHMLVSLNGILQAPITSFTVSGSTLTFASNLATGDVIDFVILLGNVLDLGVVSDNTISTAKIQDDAVTAAKLGAGAIAQVVQTEKTDTFTTSSGTFTDITGLTVDITPSATSSKILVLMNTYISNAASTYVTQIRLVRDSTAISVGDAASNRTQSTAHIRMADIYQVGSFSASTLDSPSTTSATTYKVQMLVQTGGGSTGALNRTGNDSDNDYQGRTASSITVMEVLA